VNGATQRRPDSPSWPDDIVASQKPIASSGAGAWWDVPAAPADLEWSYGCLAEKRFEPIRGLRVPFYRR